MTLALLAAAWLAGLLLGFRFDAETWPVLLLALATFPFGLMLYLIRRSAWPAVLAGVLLLGLWRVEVTQSAVTPLVTQDSQQASIKGQIASDPEASAQRIKFVLDVEAVDRGDGWQPLPRKALVYADPPEPMVSQREPPYFRYGDTLTMQGALQQPKPFEGFDYPAYLANRGIDGIFWSRQVEWSPQESDSGWRGWVFDLRRSLSESLESALPVPHSALAQALLLDVRGGLSEEVVEKFRNTGTLHLIAISGLQVGVLLVMTIGVSSGLMGQRWQVYLLLPLLAIWDYALISGLPVSVVRAAIMGSTYLLARFVGRPQSALAPLSFSAALITAFDPWALLQISFQLSFAGVAGMILALPYQAKVAANIRGGLRSDSAWWEWWLRHFLNWTVAAIIVSLGATLATLPVVAFNFHQIPVLGIPLTILALPAMPFMLAGSLATALAGLIHPWLGQFFGWLTWAPISYFLSLVSVAPGVIVSGSWVSTPLVWVWYLALLGLLLLPRGLGYLRRMAGNLIGLFTRPALTGPVSLRPNGLTLSVLGCAIILAASAISLWAQILSGPDGKLHVYFFNVGQGDSMLVVTPNGRQVLIDGGPAVESATLALAGPLSRWDRSLDLMALTHLDADHSRGLLEALDRYQVGGVLVGIEDPASPLYPQWQAALERQQLDAIQVSAGYQVALDEGVVLEVLHPASFPGPASDRNNNSLVFRLVYGDLSFLLTGDIEAEAERYLAQTSASLASSVLKVAHHGSKTSTTAEFLQRASPTMAVISAGADNRFGHPHPDVVARLEQAVGEDSIYQTAEQGNIHFISDGHSLWVKTRR